MYSDLNPMNMRSERIRIRLSSAEAAKRLGVTANTLLAWERGEIEPCASKLAAMSALYCCSIDYLMGRTSERTGQPVVVRR